jgi:hypothetical protein
MSEHLSNYALTPSEIITESSSDRSFYKSPLDGERAIEAAYAAKPFMDVAV